MKKYWLKEMREKCGISLEEASALSSISLGYLKNLETECQHPGIKILTKLARIYGCRVKDLICEEEMNGSGVALKIAIEKTDEIIEAKRIKFQQKVWETLKQGKAIHREDVLYESQEIDQLINLRAQLDKVKESIKQKNSGND